MPSRCSIVAFVAFVAIAFVGVGRSETTRLGKQLAREKKNEHCGFLGIGYVQIRQHDYNGYRWGEGWMPPSHGPDGVRAYDAEEEESL